MAETKTKSTKKAAEKAVVKKQVVKKTPKPVEPMVAKEAKIKVEKPTESKAVSLKVAVVGVDGASKGNMTLPEAVFGTTPNKTLIAQAIRVYLANQRQGNASTKNRGEVVGSTRKIYRQKGTGRARHGAVKAPIFVGGGIAFGPRPHDFSLKMPAQMRKKALISALSEKAQAGFVKVVEGEFTGKTKEVSKLMKSLELGKNGKALFVIDNNESAKRASRNIAGLAVESADTLSTYEVVVNKNVIFLKNAVEVLSKRLTN